MHNPLLSIVIANFNYGRFLEDAIRSVVSQRAFEDCELIVVDGGSTDNSVEIIKKYAGKIAWWVSEPDKGQSDAFNKGFAQARGKYLTWLNADDLMPRGCLCEVIAQLKAHPACDWFTGNMFRFTQDDEILSIAWGPHWYPGFMQRACSPLVIFGPAAFFTRKIYEQVGRMDESMHLTMDTDLWIRFMSYGIKQRRIRCFCWAFRMHKGSKTAEYGEHVLDREQTDKLRQEFERTSEKTHYQMSRWLWLCVLVLRLIDGSFLRRLYYRMALRKASKLMEG